MVIPVAEKSLSTAEPSQLPEEIRVPGSAVQMEMSKTLQAMVEPSQLTAETLPRQGTVNMQMFPTSAAQLETTE